LLEATYLSQVDGLGGVKVRYVGEIVEGDRAEVRARLLGKKNREVTVDARLVRRGERWFVWDVAIAASASSATIVPGSTGSFAARRTPSW
jgi:hypothetical protein